MCGKVCTVVPYELWLAKASFSLHKSGASEATNRSAKASGRQLSGPLAASFSPESVGTLVPRVGTSTFFGTYGFVRLRLLKPYPVSRKRLS